MEGLVSRDKLQILHRVLRIEAGRFRLNAWKRDAGARTVLAVEENGIRVTNCHVVTDAVFEAESTLGHAAADEIYLVTTSFAPWQVHFLRVDDRSYFDLMNPHDRSWDADPTLLVSLAGR